MQKLNKTMATIITILLTVSMAIPLMTLPTTDAHSPTWEIPTWAYITANPNPVGVGQNVFLVMWLTLAPPGASVSNDLRWRNFSIDVTRPDGTNEKLGPFNSDSTGGTYTLYTPTQVGNYTFVLTFPGQILTTTGTYANDTFKASSWTATCTVQENQIPEAISYPLPTEYWTRPIEGQNSAWFKVASNWLRDPQFVSLAGINQPNSVYQKDGIAPTSAHIMWVKPLEVGGVVGGSNTAIEGNVFYSGTQYNARFDAPIIMYGKLYTKVPRDNAGGGGGYTCIDLVTGKTEWLRTDIPDAAFGYYYALESPNQHGIVPPGLLFTNNFAQAINPSTGDIAFNMTNVPTGFSITGPSGEILRYSITNIGTTSQPDWRLTQWNSSRAFTVPGASGGYSTASVNASLASRYDWNVSIPVALSSPSIEAVMRNDLMLCRNGTLPSVGNWAPYTYFALSLKPESRGQLMWMKNYDPPPGNLTLLNRPFSAAEGVWVLLYKETMQWVAYDMYTGNLLWGPTDPEPPFQYYSAATSGKRVTTIADGIFYSTGYSGKVFAYNLTTGKLLWEFETDSGVNTVYGGYPLHVGAVCDGKVYLGTHEHSASTPLYKGAYVYCLNTTTGKPIWDLMGWGASFSFAVADGYLVYDNLYDQQVYCIGKGPSAMTVTAPDVAVEFGKSLVIRGTVTDESPGSKIKGTAAISDESMGDWMAYQFMQKPRPTNTTGVPVSIDVIDANGNYRNIGTATSDMTGMFSYTWKPDIEGSYTVIASFAGSESYWPSYAETSFAVDSAPQAANAPTAAPVSIAETYFVPAFAGVFVAIVIVIALLVLVLRKRP